VMGINKLSSPRHEKASSNMTIKATIIEINTPSKMPIWLPMVSGMFMQRKAVIKKAKLPSQLLKPSLVLYLMRPYFTPINAAMASAKVNTKILML